ncbi:MAG: GNAT family N-acetyltransferase [Clostridiales bacterium]|nr:GNAT family N-acetyltransferase [Clostridiales bacterium]
MPIIDVNLNNIDTEHICCAISDKKGENCVGSKKAWMKDRFRDGLVFKKLDERGKVFIEYIPAEYAFAPIEASNYMYINCFWVSGKYKGQGYANKLLDECIKDAKSKNKDGLVVLSSAKKKPFLSDPSYLKYKGFTVCDTAEPFFELLYLPFANDTAIPKFKECAKQGKIKKKGIVIYYTNQCPHTDKYVGIIKSVAEENNIHLETIKIDTVKDAQNAPSPFTTYTIFKNGKFITNEILTEKKFLQLASE